MIFFQFYSELRLLFYFRSSVIPLFDTFLKSVLRAVCCCCTQARSYPVRNNTESMRWTTPLVALRSEKVTLAVLFTVTMEPVDRE